VAVSAGPGTSAAPADRILIWGAGAIGGTVGAYLARAGFHITLVDSHVEHVEAIRHKGLAIVGPIETFTQTVPTLRPEDVGGTWDTVFLCVKALHTEVSARALVPHLMADGVVVSLQNGFNELVIADVVGRMRTMGAFINFGADVLEPGVVHYGGRGAVVVGELDGRHTERLTRVHRALLWFEPNAIETDNIWGYLWGKMGYGALLFASALTDASIVDVLGSIEARPVLTALAREVMTVACAEGVTVLGFNGYDPEAFAPGGSPAAVDASFEAMVAFNRRSAKTHTGVWRDIAVHHRKTEVDAQFGPLVGMARAHGIAVPHVDRMIALMHDVERRVRPQAWETLHAVASATSGG
jgi:2-dehydropantoate 2-reductase